MKDEIWTTKSGDEMFVGDMTEDHAKNCLRMLMRKNQDHCQCCFCKTQRYEASQRELQRQSEAEFWKDEYRYGVGSDD